MGSTGRGYGDVEAGRSRARPLDGFPALAEFIASDPDHTSLVFKRFDRLAARNLLYLQSQLADLEARQDQYDEEDRGITSDLETKRCAMNWESFEKAAADPENKKQQERMRLAEAIGKKLKEYREALLFESTLACLKSPPPRTFDAMLHASSRLNKDLKIYEPILGGHNATLYSSNEDLVLLKQPEHDDRLTAFVQRFLPVFFLSQRRENNMAYVPEKKIARFVTVLSILIAVILLFVAIICLYYIKSPTTKLVMVGIFMLLFAASVGLFTTAKRSEVFAATAAYAAVLVVFVSGDLGSERPD